jgi:FSR family fosmidomycin resistance protein-like MFS transporter
MQWIARRFGRMSRVVFVILFIEFLDELVFGAEGAALPLIRHDLNLTYDQVGLLLSLPNLFAAVFLDPFITLYGDTPYRRRLMLVGGLCFVASLCLAAVSVSFPMILLAFMVFSPASGAFVNLAQATLMDIQPERHEHNMARWTLAGSVGVVVGSLLIGGIVAVGASWRLFYGVAFALTLGCVVYLWRMPFPHIPHLAPEAHERISLWRNLRRALAALRDREVLRWLTLLQFSDLMLDVLFSYLALYFVDVAGVTAEQAALGVAVWTVVGLVGDAALIPLLERVDGVRYLRFNAAVQVVVYSAFLLTPSYELKLVLTGINGFLNSGWYAILQANVYTAMPEQSAASQFVGGIFGLVGGLLPLLVGLSAERIGLGPTMVFPLIGCAAMLIGLPVRGRLRQPLALSDD